MKFCFGVLLHLKISMQGKSGFLLNMDQALELPNWPDLMTNLPLNPNWKTIHSSETLFAKPNLFGLSYTPSQI